MRLPEHEARHFLVLYMRVLGWCAGRLDPEGDIHDARSFMRADLDEKVDVRDRVLDQPTVIAEYAAENPDELAVDDLARVEAWRAFVRGNFVVERDLKRHAIFLDWKEDPVAYGVLSLLDDVVDLLPEPPPILVDAVLLPWGDRIVCDGMVRSRHVHLGPEIRRRLKAVYRRAKERGIVTALASAPESGTASTETSAGETGATGRIRPEHLEGLRGLRRTAATALLERQPSTVTEALAIPGIGRAVTGRLVELRLLADPGVQTGRAGAPTEQRTTRGPESAFAGRWRVVEIDGLHIDHYEMERMALIEFAEGGEGSFESGLVSAETDCRFSAIDGAPVVEFSWVGLDDDEPAVGRGWASIDEHGMLRGMIFMHRGEEVEVMAVKLAGTGKKAR